MVRLGKVHTKQMTWTTSIHFKLSISRFIQKYFHFTLIGWLRFIFIVIENERVG